VFVAVELMKALTFCLCVVFPVIDKLISARQTGRLVDWHKVLLQSVFLSLSSLLLL